MENRTLITDNFSNIYPYLNYYVMTFGDSINVRGEDVTEVLDFKTILTNPRKRLVGGEGLYRRQNPFFLLAEAIWIWLGRKDVFWLDLFNKNMKNFSDDGKVFNAPYGWRIRNFDIPSDSDEKGLDQMVKVLELLKQSPNTRRAVIQIWNSKFDLKPSKDIPCNDLLMFKIRNGKLYTFIANRSNDLHWGLVTNIFQFSFLTEIMADILSIDLGEQVHNSHSLHVYMNLNNVGNDLMLNWLSLNKSFRDLYEFSKPKRMGINFVSKKILSRVSEVDYWLNNIVQSVINNKSEFDEENLKFFSEWFFIVYKLLNFYVNFYKVGKIDRIKRLQGLKILNDLRVEHGDIDIIISSMNFVSKGLNEEEILNVVNEWNLSKVLGKM